MTGKEILVNLAGVEMPDLEAVRARCLAQGETHDDAAGMVAATAKPRHKFRARKLWISLIAAILLLSMSATVLGATVPGVNDFIYNYISQDFADWTAGMNPKMNEGLERYANAVDPIDPIDPVAPVNPVEPADPVEPSEPSDPGKKPNNPEKPSNPSEPSNPEPPQPSPSGFIFEATTFEYNLNGYTLKIANFDRNKSEMPIVIYDSKGHYVAGDMDSDGQIGPSDLNKQISSLYDGTLHLEPLSVGTHEIYIYSMLSNRYMVSTSKIIPVSDTKGLINTVRITILP